MRARVASPNCPRVSAAKPKTTAHPGKLDSDKFGDDQIGCLIESCTSLMPPPLATPLRIGCCRIYVSFPKRDVAKKTSMKIPKPPKSGGFRVRILYYSSMVLRCSRGLAYISAGSRSTDHRPRCFEKLSHRRAEKFLNFRNFVSCFLSTYMLKLHKEHML